MSNDRISCLAMKLLRWLGGGSAALIAITAIVTWAADTRYETKTESVARYEKATAQFKVDLRYTADQISKAALELEVHKLDRIPEAKRTTEQRADLAYYLRKIAEINAKWPVVPGLSVQ